jgi:hypothetical protein
VGGGLQIQTDLAILPSGDVWVMSNWQDIDSCVGTPDEALSTRCGGQGVVVFVGVAKPVRAPQLRVVVGRLSPGRKQKLQSGLDGRSDYRRGSLPLKCNGPTAQALASSLSDWSLAD